MPFFSVLIHGQGINIPATDGAETIIGFYTTRVVRASGLKDAETKAVTSVRKEWQRPPLLGQNQGEAPLLEVEKVFSATLLKALVTRNKGFTFYSQK